MRSRHLLMIVAVLASPDAGCETGITTVQPRTDQRALAEAPQKKGRLGETLQDHSRMAPLRRLARGHRSRPMPRHGNRPVPGLAPVLGAASGERAADEPTGHRVADGDDFSRHAGAGGAQLARPDRGPPLGGRHPEGPRRRTRPEAEGPGRRAESRRRCHPGQGRLLEIDSPGLAVILALSWVLGRFNRPIVRYAPGAYGDWCAFARSIDVNEHYQLSINCRGCRRWRRPTPALDLPRFAPAVGPERGVGALG